MVEPKQRVRASGSALRRLATHAAQETGDTMIEVVIAALLVGLIAAAIFTGFSAVAGIAGGQRHQSQADELAQQDQERLRSLSVGQLSATASGSSCPTTAPADGNGCYTQTIDNEAYTITSSTQFVSAAGGTASCSGSGSTGSADYIAIQSEVQWGANSKNDGNPPVIVHSLVSPPGGGGLVVSAQDSAGNNLAGVGVAVEGPGTSTSTETLTTDSNGCAVFGGLTGGTYSVTATAPAGYLTGNDTSSSSSTTLNESVIVISGRTQTPSPLVFGQAGTAEATFQTFIDGLVPTSLSWDSFSISSGTVTPSPQTFGTAGGTPAASVFSPALTQYPSIYNAYAGSCAADDPEGSTSTTGTTGTTGATPAAYQDPSLSVPPGGTGTAVVTVPTMLLALSTTNTPTVNTPSDDTSANATYSSTTSSNGHGGHTTTPDWSAVSNSNDYNGTEHDTAVSGATVSFAFTGTGVGLVVPEENQWGEASISIDGTQVATIDEQSTTSTYKVLIWNDYGSLSNGSHTLVVTNIHLNDAQSSGYTIGVDEFIVSAPGTPVSTAVNASTLPYTVATDDSCTPPVARAAVPASPSSRSVGSSTVYPVQAPYGSSIQVCFTNPATNTNTGPLPPTGSTQISNTNLNGTTITSLPLPTISSATGTNAQFSYLGACTT